MPSAEGHRHAQRPGVNRLTANPPDAMPPTCDFPDPVIDTYALFLQDSIQWMRLDLPAGLRYDHTRIKPKLTDEFLNTLVQSGDDSGEPLNSVNLLKAVSGVDYD